ncbi:MAG: aspartate kinase [Candidatus Endonucleobacter bathymodioli]|uniref:Aspartokinase n=1 Tax=Candidatus Endonucleibacter bathymodioli TaxID=539814 RepID=A0AA90NN45_9GAMM|nr:aspartate kinase [Candidatus Endonucleobacter bathymodioli]
MALIVLKFGGTSVGDLDRIQLVAEKVKGFKAQGYSIVVVVSAMSGETNRLIKLAKVVKGANDTREMDVILSTGEQVTIALVSMALNSADCPAVSLTGSQVGISTDSAHTKARIQNINTDTVRRHLDAGRVVVIAGFQGCDSAGNITTLGRGGSDTTAVAMAAALKADECRIYTDVDGVFTTDPRIVEDARLLESITFEEMLEMASLGSKVLHIRAVAFAGKYNVKLRVLNSFQEGVGTVITLDKGREMESEIVSGIAFSGDEAKLTIRGVPHVPGVAVHILGPVGRANIEVDMIVQNVGEDQATDFTFTVSRNNYQNAMSILSLVADDLKASGYDGDSKIAKVSIIGVGMRSHAGVATRMFEALAQEGINIEIIATSEIRISVVIAEKYLELAVRALHVAFGLEREPFKTSDV